MPLRSLLPYSFNKRLFGDRKKYGRVIDELDNDWKKWQQIDSIFYDQNQVSGIGKKVNLAAASAVKQVDIEKKVILELGPGEMLHSNYWDGIPGKYYIADRSTRMLEKSVSVLEGKKVDYSKVILHKSIVEFNLPDASIDMILSFATLEHLHPLEDFLSEFRRLLKPGGQIVGSIPTEGGLAWGMGRYLTTRRWFIDNTNIDPDKIICWEHPNFSDYILKSMNNMFTLQDLKFWPLKIPLIDTNLVIKFVFKK